MTTTTTKADRLAEIEERRAELTERLGRAERRGDRNAAIDYRRLIEDLEFMAARLVEAS